MNLQGRDLKLDLSGDDVQELHSELTLIGLQIPETERKRVTFGEGTREVVIRFQQEHRLAPTGVVDQVTASAIGQIVFAITYTVEGAVASPDRAGVGALRV